MPKTSVRNLLFPAADWPDLRKAALLSLAGAVFAGLFGILHDQITYTISPEYFSAGLWPYRGLVLLRRQIQF